FFFFQAEDGIRDRNVTGVQTCALPILILSNSSNVSILMNPPVLKVHQLLGRDRNEERIGWFLINGPTTNIASKYIEYCLQFSGRSEERRVGKGCSVGCASETRQRKDKR